MVEYYPPTTEEVRDENGKLIATWTKQRPMLTDEDRERMKKEVEEEESTQIATYGRARKQEDKYFPPIRFEKRDTKGQMTVKVEVYRPILTDKERAKREEEVKRAMVNLMRSEERGKWLNEHQAQE